MLIDQRVSLPKNAIAEQVVYEKEDGGQIFLRAADITAVEELRPVATDASGPEDRCRIYWAEENNVVVRESATTAQADINALADAIPLGEIYVQDQKTSGTDGGTATSGSWQTRDLNTIVFDPALLASLSSNQLTLPSGTYEVIVVVPAQRVFGLQSRLQNITAGTTTVFGTTERTAGNHMVPSVIAGLFTIAGDTVFEIQMQVESSNATVGFGQAKGFVGSSEVYTSAFFNRIQ